MRPVRTRIKMIMTDCLKVLIKKPLRNCQCASNDYKFEEVSLATGMGLFDGDDDYVYAGYGFEDEYSLDEALDELVSRTMMKRKKKKRGRAVLILEEACRLGSCAD